MKHSLFVLQALLFLGVSALAEDGKIVGGEEAAPHSIPWQVSLRRKSDNFHFCGGSVLGPNHVVSAAHCTVIWDSPDEVVVVAGEHDRSVDEGTEQMVPVSKLTVHESYGSPKNFENDIAIWELAEPLEMNDYVAAVALPEPMKQSEGECTVSGWGTLHSGDSSTPNVLMKVDVPVVDDGRCKIEYPFSIAESMLCAGEHGKDSCQGDSGGPMICYNSDGSGYLGGIVSWGIGCGGYFHPGVYTEVSYFTEWINANMRGSREPNQTNCEECSAVISTTGVYLTSDESISAQIDILLTGLCPTATNPEECVEGLPGFWTKVAMVLWEGYYNPSEVWMCATEDICGAPESKSNLGMICDVCVANIMYTIDQILQEEFVTGIVDAMSGEWFCGMEEDPEMCATVIAELIPAALPLLAAAFEPETAKDICNMAIPDTCMA